MKLGGAPYRNFQILDEGDHNAVLAAIQDMGMVTSNFDGHERDQHKIRFVWLTDELDPFDEPLIAMQMLTNSLNEKSTLRKIITIILGKDPGNEIDDAFVLNAQCRITITHKQGDRRTYANVTQVAKQTDPSVNVIIPNDWKPPIVKNYRAPVVPMAAITNDNSREITDEDIPF
jgi:hypothetical protein